MPVKIIADSAIKNISSGKKSKVRHAKIPKGEEKKPDQVNHELKKDLFYIFNNSDLRHNNCTDKTKKYKPVIAGMDRDEPENRYDETYRMCLLAFMEIEQADRKPGIDGIKARIEAEQTRSAVCPRRAAVAFQPHPEDTPPPENTPTAP